MKIGVAGKHAIDGHRIFVIDRDVVNRSALYFMISDDNEIHELENIVDTAEISRLQVPDLMIVNALLVAEHGKTLIESWRAAWPRVKVLMICEACGTECVAAAKAAGADDTLQRPFTRDEVQRTVARWVDASANKMKMLPKRRGAALHAH